MSIKSSPFDFSSMASICLVMSEGLNFLMTNLPAFSRGSMFQPKSFMCSRRRSGVSSRVM